MADLEVLHRRLREMRSRALILAWEHRQRGHAKGALARVLRELAYARSAYAISEEDAQALVRAGGEPLPVGQDLQPRMTLFRVDEQALLSLASRKSLPMHWRAPLLGTRFLALVPFVSNAKGSPQTAPTAPKR